MLKKWLLFFVVVTGFAILLAAQNSNVFVTRAELRGGQKWLVITGYTGNEKAVTIPANIDGVPVRKIGDMAFKLKRLTDIALPQGLEVIGEQAFFGNQLSIVVIPASVRIIADSAFDSNMLKKVTNAGLTENTGSYKTPAKSNIYYIAADKQHLSAELLNKASKLHGNFYNPLTGYDGMFKPVSGPGTPASPITKNIAASNTANSFMPQSSDNASYSRIYIEVPGDYTGISAIPVLNSTVVSKNSALAGNKPASSSPLQTANDGVLSTKAGMVIEKFAYRNKGLDSVVIPEGTMFIGEGAFASNNLSSVVIPNSVQSIGSQAFMGNDLGYITIGENVKVQSDSFRYQFADYYRMNDYKAGTYVLKAGHWNLSGQKAPSKQMR
ncbi:MAG: leucine-rich repeat domain-containing protein [Spirochaetaceae bacterium]|jgi:hypothetical protein|nr:leucine-rich repeat domain-containing protein [Spirochaetaceae bacterium]